ncbi:Bacterial extracellular solute-binding proteins, family 3 [Vibrio aerogenes CECT 7868]|uniref:Bacterial extracellular solute-binding proteins, family 3 n=1 Tax=Vibrio aerogenes CECT 7868 TaxID=1216006 RepID=A0A1M5ZSB9_9VIBR|nr:transporter substrate-binding domain-containing protein [Vibrio aerogenes]SHI26823.1 Bacterial extracellular solute-binding proteins, family 3 [Vibrio aerogenes CECT 7868]
MWVRSEVPGDILNKRSLIILFLMLCQYAFGAPAFASAISEATSEPVIVSTVNYPPYIYPEQLLPLGYGLGRDIVSESFALVNLPAEFQVLPMSRNVWSLREGRVNANLGVSGWFQADGMSAQIDNVDILNMNFVLFYKRQRFPDGFSFSQLSGLSPYTIGNVRGSATTRIVERAGLNVSYASRIVQNLRKLEAGRIDFAIAVDLAGWQIIHEHFPDKMHEFATIKQPILTVPLAVIFRKEDQVLKDKFIHGFQQLIASKRYIQILQKYYHHVRIDRQDIPRSVYAQFDDSCPELTDLLDGEDSLTRQ